MSKAKQVSVLAGMLAAMALAQGCALLLLGGAAAGAAYGTVKYVNNSLESTQNTPMDKVWDAANTALRELQMPVATSRKDATYGRLEARNAKGQPVVIEAARKSDDLTDVKITVGTFDSADNRSQAQLIFDKMRAHF